MSNEYDFGRPEPPNWLAESLRLTAFPSPSAEMGTNGWWEKLLGRDPDNVISRRREGLQVEQGVFENGQLAVAVEPGRIDWPFTPIAEARVIGPLTEVLEPFRELMLRWLQISPPLQRLAYGAVLKFPVNDRQGGYLHIAQYLPNVKLDPENSSDFLYQINRPRSIRWNDFQIKVNRLTKWSVAQRHLATIPIGVQLAAIKFLPTPEEVSARLELDINTAAEFTGELPKPLLPRIFQALTELGNEIANGGDIP